MPYHLFNAFKLMIIVILNLYFRLLSSRPMTAGTPVPGEYLMTQSPLNVKDTLRRAKTEGADLKVNQLIYHHSDFSVSPIVDNPKVRLSSIL